MKTSEINSSLIGKKVECVFTGLKTTGTIINIIDEEYSKGVRIKFDEPINWGGDWYEEFESTARKSDEFGNLNHTKLIYI